MFICDCGKPVASEQIIGHIQECRLFFNKYGGLIGNLCNLHPTSQSSQCLTYQQQQRQTLIVYEILASFLNNLSNHARVDHRDINC